MSPHPKKPDLARESVAGEEDPGAALDTSVNPDVSGARSGIRDDTCPRCGGSGHIPQGPCPDCAGTGKRAAAA
jgi:hypothetical protein